MKLTVHTLLLSLVMLTLSACIDQSLKKQQILNHQQITALNTDCETREIKISEQSTELNGTENWTAECNGKTYRCSYLSESGADCYEISKK